MTIAKRFGKYAFFSPPLQKGVWTKLGQQRANGERKMDTPAPLPT